MLWVCWCQCVPQRQFSCSIQACTSTDMAWTIWSPLHCQIFGLYSDLLLLDSQLQAAHHSALVCHHLDSWGQSRIWWCIYMSLLSDPVIKGFNHTKLVVLWTAFISLDFGFVLLQPENNQASANAATEYCAGKGFSCMNSDTKTTLHPMCFGACRTCGN